MRPRRRQSYRSESNTADADWGCPSCGRSNPIQLSQCRFCRTANPAPIELSPDPAEVVWTCPSCSRSNAIEKPQCRFCLTANPSPVEPIACSEPVTASGQATAPVAPPAYVEVWKCSTCGHLIEVEVRECPRCVASSRPHVVSPSQSDSWFTTDDLVLSATYEPNNVSPKDRILAQKMRAELLRDIMDYEERRKSPGQYYVRKTAEGAFTLAGWIIKGIACMIVAVLAPLFFYQCQHITDDGVPGYHPTFQDYRSPIGR